MFFDAEVVSADHRCSLVDAVTQRSEFGGLCVEVFQDADRCSVEACRSSPTHSWRFEDELLVRLALLQ